MLQAILLAKVLINCAYVKLCSFIVAGRLFNNDAR